MKYFLKVPAKQLLSGIKTKRKVFGSIIFSIVFVLSGMILSAQTDIDSTLKFTDAIRLNQIGFYTYSPKLAVVCSDTSETFQIYLDDWSKVVFRGKLSEVKTSNLSGKKTRHADFSNFKQSGKYILAVPGLGVSYPFLIDNYVHHNLAKATLKSFYYQRMSTTLPAKYAGKWSRGLSHPDKKVYIHSSAAGPKRLADAVIASPGGWYDAGDYNKYIVNSGITMATLMMLYEDFSENFDTLSLNLPESKNAIPDLLDEVLYNLRWMLTMQDPDDGGIYHKCTTADFEGFIKPENAKDKRYVVQKSTAAALDFAAVMAQASRVYGKFDKQLPGLADSCRTAAIAAWKWAQRNANTMYDQDALNKTFDPDITTGAYGDKNLTDEFYWAAVELYAVTADTVYLNSFRKSVNQKIDIPSWSNVHALGNYTLLRFRKKFSPALTNEINTLRTQLIFFAGAQTKSVDTYAYRAPIENAVDNFVWGSNAVAANQGILLLQAFRVTGEMRYVEKARDNLDYILGRNATGYSYVTGFGSKTPMHPHHRPSETDKVKEPVPGLLAGGPNPGQQDKCTTYTSKIYDESYTDDVCSYASNEIAINWNAPLVYLTFFIDIVLK